MGLIFEKKLANPALLFFVFFFILFFPKVGAFDFSFLGVFLGYFYLLIKVGSPKIHYYFIPIVCLTLLILVYNNLVFSLNLISNSQVEFNSLFRIFRSLFILYFFVIFFSNFLVSIRTFLNIILALLLLNSLFVILQVVFPNLQNYMAGFTGYYQSSFYSLRSFGLTGSFDGAGFLSCVGLILVYLKIYWEKKISVFLFIIFVLFCLSVVFTGRTSIVLSLFVHLIGIFKLLFSGNTRLRVFSLSLILSIGLVFIVYVLPLLVLTINAFGFDYLSFYESDINYDKSFNINQTDVYSELLVFPQTLSGIFFGNSFSPVTDYGYLILLHFSGLFGLFLIFVLYSLIFYQTKKYGTCHTVYQKILFYFSGFYLLILLFFNLKLLFVFSRTFSDLHWILLTFLISLRTTDNKS